MKFRHLDVPSHWEHYWTRYPEGYTILEALFSWVKQVDDMIDNQNKLNDNVAQFRKEIDEFIGRFDSRLQDEVTQTLRDWQESGFLDVVINEALDTKYHEMEDRLNAQLAEVGRSVTEFGAVGDGVTNDTEAIQEALDFGGVILFPTGTYYFNRVELRKSDTKVVFGKNVTLKSDDQGDNLDAGAFNILGEISDTASILNTIEIGDKSFKVENLAPFKVGDLVSITQDQPQTHARDYTIHKQFYSQSLVTIRAIDPVNNVIGINEASEHRFFASPKLTLIKPIENIQIIGNGTKFDKMGTTEYSNHFNIQNAKNFHIEGFETFNGGGKGLSINRTFQYTAKNMVHHSPTNISAGHGYGLITRASSYGLIDNHYTYNSRHAVDVSTMSYQTIVKNSYGFNSPFTTHGTNTQFLTFENCHVIGSGFSIGNYSFWSDNNVKIVNCSVHGGDSAGVNIASGTYNVIIDNLDVTNSLTGITVLGKCDNVITSNVRISDVSTGIQMRSKNNTTTNIVIENFRTYGVELGDGTSGLIFDNIKISSDSQSQAIRFSNCSNVSFNNLEISGLYSRVLYFDVDTNDIQLSHARIETTGSRMIELVSSDKNIALSINDSILSHSEAILVKTDLGINGLTLNNNKLNGPLTIRGIDNVFITNNEVNDTITLNSGATNMLVTGNYGTGLLSEKPVNNGKVLVDINTV